MSKQKDIFKTEITVELPRNLEANILMITYDPADMSGTEESVMKAEIGEAIHKVIDNYYGVTMKAYKIVKP